MHPRTFPPCWRSIQFLDHKSIEVDHPTPENSVKFEDWIEFAVPGTPTSRSTTREFRTERVLTAVESLAIVPKSTAEEKMQPRQSQQVALEAYGCVPDGLSW